MITVRGQRPRQERMHFGARRAQRNLMSRKLTSSFPRRCIYTQCLSSVYWAQFQTAAGQEESSVVLCECTGGRGFECVYDETVCTGKPSKKVCEAGQFTCTTGEDCLDAELVCDGEIDCPNGEDEANCSESLSTAYQLCFVN
ncbi:unnamed protein product [Protopolystoma xenopodis]|uniref:EGF-like domain-containing protein n=1 Tax=Protopolystoma xenopodis TaxID=117903 RepID=A0A3S5FBX8_9PLAT|nr:unnamed protein product [Protopolystoma xenopodis]